MIKRRRLPCFLLLTLLLAFPSSPSIAQAQPEPNDSTLSDCVDNRRSLSVLFLVDTSASLRYNDPQNGRVQAILSALSVLGSLQSTTDAEVWVDFLEFSNTASRSFPSRSEWTIVPVEQEEQRRIANTYTERNDGAITDYVGALEPWIRPAEKPANEIGALELLGRAPENSCRMLVWLTDGQLDVRYNGVERTVYWTHPPTLVNSSDVDEALNREAIDRLCANGGLADELRSGADITSGSSAQLAVVALDPTGTLDFGLLRSLATDDDCGSRTPRGTFVSATDISELIVEVYKRVLGEGTNSSNTTSCLYESGATNLCGNVDPDENASTQYDFPFDLSAGIYGFNLLSLSSHHSVDTSIITPSGELYPLTASHDLRLENGAELSVRQLDILQGGFLIEADLDPGGSWRGRWRVRYSTSDPEIAAELNRASIYVFGGLMIELDREGTNLRVGHDGEIALRAVGIAGEVPTSGSLDADTELQLRVGTETVSVPFQDADGRYTISYEVPAEFTGDTVVLSTTFRASIQLSPNAPPVRLRTWEGDLGEVNVEPVARFPVIDPPRPFEGAINNSQRRLSTTMMISAAQRGSGGCIELISVAPPRVGAEIIGVEISYEGSLMSSDESCPIRLNDGEMGTLSLTIDVGDVDLAGIPDEELTGVVMFRSISAVDPTILGESSYVVNIAVEPLAESAPSIGTTPSIPVEVPDSSGSQSPAESGDTRESSPVDYASDLTVASGLLAAAAVLLLTMLYVQNVWSARLDRRQVGFARFEVRVSGESMERLSDDASAAGEEVDMSIGDRRSIILGDVQIRARSPFNPFGNVYLRATTESDSVVVANDGTLKSGRVGRSFSGLSSVWIFQTERSSVLVDEDGVQQPFSGQVTIVLPEDEWSNLETMAREILRRDNRKMAEVIVDSLGKLRASPKESASDELAADVSAIADEVAGVEENLDVAEHWSASDDAERSDKDEIEWHSAYDVDRND